MTQEDLHNVVRRAAAGDADAFAVLYEEFVTPLYRYIYARVRERDDAEDITQTAFIKAWDAVRTRPIENAFAPYLFTIARNLIIDRSRRRAIEPVSREDAPDVADIRPSPLALAIAGEEYRALEHALEELPDLQREAVLLRAFADMPYEEIANTLGKKESAVRQLYSRGVRTLKEKCRFDG